MLATCLGKDVFSVVESLRESLFFNSLRPILLRDAFGVKCPSGISTAAEAIALVLVVASLVLRVTAVRKGRCFGHKPIDESLLLEQID